eukprot:7205450-Ditylum_brightwellii.AAC.2
MAHLYFKQGYIAIKNLSDHLHETTAIGAQIMVALSKVQLISGSSSPNPEGVKGNRFYTQ